MNKSNIVFSGLTIPATLGLTHIAIFYSVWLALLIFIAPFVLITTFGLLCVLIGDNSG